VCGLPNSPALTEVHAPSLLEQYPQYVPHWDRAGYNTLMTLNQQMKVISE